MVKLETVNGVDYLSFRPECMERPTQLPVITQGKREGTGAWTWNGSLDAPTLRPSIRTEFVNDKGEKLVLHYWLNDGICHCLDDCTDGSAGKKIPLAKSLFR